MSRQVSSNNGKRLRRRYPTELKEDAVRMMEDGRSVQSIARNLGIEPSIIDTWRSSLRCSSEQSHSADSPLQQRVRELEQQLRQVERERDCYKKALAILSQQKPGGYTP